MRRYSMRVAIHAPEHDGATGYHYAEGVEHPEGEWVMYEDAHRRVDEAHDIGYERGWKHRAYAHQLEAWPPESHLRETEESE